MSRLIKPTSKTKISEIEATAGIGGKLLYTDYHGQQAALLIQDNRLKAARFFPKKQSKIGGIYICKVKNVVPNLGAYFVEIGIEEREICFLSQKDAAHPFLLNRPYDGRILEGDEFPVQVVRDAQKTKQASVTTFLSISNDCFALSVGSTHAGYSSKLSREEKNRLQQLLKEEAFRLPNISLPHKVSDSDKVLSVGMVVRTLAANRASDDLQTLFSELLNQWTTLFQTAMHRNCFSCLLEAPHPWQAALEQLAYSGEYDEIITDQDKIYNQLLESTHNFNDKKVRLYKETDFSLTKLYALDSKLETATKRRVWLKTGGYLIIDPTEALTVIDVNSGKYEGRKGTDETFCRINREAAEEVALQLRLRNLSGIIVVDFINMQESEHQKDLLNYLKKLVSADRTKTVVVDMTPLGLVEITRQKTYKTLSEQIEWMETNRSESWR